MKIFNIYNEVIYKGEADSIRQLVEMAVSEGVPLNYANLEGANLEGADLALADFAEANLVRANLEGANLEGADLANADFKGANLAGANMIGANMTGANLFRAKIERAYLAWANMTGVKLGLDIPIIEDIHQKVYEAASREGALEMDDWHTCDTTHCIAGWVITLAGDEGKKLEARISTETAANLIYRESDSEGRIPDFYESNKGALKELKELAKK